MNSLPKTVTRQRHDCDLNPGPFAPESSTLTYPENLLQFEIAPGNTGNLLEFR